MPANYRTLSLLSIPGKGFFKILLERMSEVAGGTVSERQFRFLSGRGTIDATFILCKITEKAKEHRVALNLHFIDLKSAFDTVWIEAL